VGLGLASRAPCGVLRCGRSWTRCFDVRPAPRAVTAPRAAA